MTTQLPLIDAARRAFHKALIDSILTKDKAGIVTIADKHSRSSRVIACSLLDQLGTYAQEARLAGQMSGNRFEAICAAFLQNTFLELAHLRPGNWHVEQLGGRNRLAIADYVQYAHLKALSEAAAENRELAAALGSDYTITPDIVVVREPEPDKSINLPKTIVGAASCHGTDLRSVNNELPILHASISCKWTVRSDRAQNSRSEALNLVKNRKGRLPHVAAITAEPLPSRIAALALGTGEIDCVYHFALYELQHAVEAEALEDAADLLHIMVEGKRLKDISDLPFDIAV